MRLFYLFILLIGLTLYVILGTNVGVHLTYYALQYTLPGKLNIQELDGKLLSHITLSNLNYHNESIDIYVDKIDLKWDGKSLFATKIIIHHLNADNVKIASHPQATSSDSFEFSSLAHYLKHVYIKKMAVNYLNINTPSIKKLTIPAIILVKLKPQQYRTKIQFEQGNIDGQLTLNNSNGLDWQAKIDVNNVSLNYANTIFENISFNLITKGNYRNELKELQLFANNIQGKVNSLALTGLIDLTYRDNLTIKSIKINVGPAKLIVNGYINSKWNIKYKLDIPQLAALIPSIKGSVGSFGIIVGPLNEPFIFSHTILKNLRSDIAIITQLNLKVNGKLTPSSALNIEVNSNDFSVSGYKIKSAHANILVKKSNTGIDAHLFHGQFKVPFINLSVNDININAVAKNHEAIAWNGTLTLGKGHAALQGKTSLLPDTAFQTHLALTGSNLLVANLPHFDITVTPTLDVNYKNNLFTTTGNIYIPSAHIVRLAHANVVSLSNDVVYEKNKSNSSSIKIANNIKVTLGNNIKLNYQNLKTQILGSLHLIQTPGGQLTAAGTLTTKDGTYAAYGKNLKIKVGKIIYVGNNILNPGLDIEAIRQINRIGNNQADFITNNHITVGIKVNGSLHQPILTLISNPSMSQTNILAYLLFDTPASQLSASNTITLMNMVVSMKNGDNNSSSTLTKIQEKIDKIGITIGSAEVYDPTSGTNKTTSTVGMSKKLSHKITVSYYTNPFNNLSVFGLHYQLNKYFVLRTQASNLETTTDIIFEIEKDD